MPEKNYKTATAFRSALESRLNRTAKENNKNLEQIRRQVAFDRFLARVFQNNAEEVVLKGGYSMALRNPKARATRDIDLAIRFKKMEDSENRLLEFLRSCALIDLNDFFAFRVNLSTLDLQAIPYGGKRFPIEALVDRRLFVKFPIDIIETSLILDPLENLSSNDWLGFAGIESKPYPTISREQQFAEKLHAYTYPRDEEENSRVKDVIDMFLLIESGEIDREFLKQAIKEVFNYRDTHDVPKEIQDPPENWEPRFKKLAGECGIGEGLFKLMSSISSFLKGIL